MQLIDNKQQGLWKLFNTELKTFTVKIKRKPFKKLFFFQNERKTHHF